MLSIHKHFLGLESLFGIEKTNLELYKHFKNVYFDNLGSKEIFKFLYLNILLGII